MSDKIFIDTNILVYAYTSGNIGKHETAKRILQNSTDRYIISTQILNEFYVSLMKYRIEHDKITDAISEITSFCEVKPVTLETVNTALAVKKRYGFSYWDSLVISAALESSCVLLYSEDMSDKQMICGNALKNLNITDETSIRNPFVEV